MAAIKSQESARLYVALWRGQRLTGMRGWAWAADSATEKGE